MPDLLVETRAQLGRLTRFATTMVELGLVRWLVGLAVLATAGWVTGTLVLLFDTLPDWALMPVAMPLFGSMIAMYSIGGISVLSLLLSVGLDLASVPFRAAGTKPRGTRMSRQPDARIRPAGRPGVRTGS